MSADFCISMEEKKCIICGKSFVPKYKIKSRKTCSRECLGKLKQSFKLSEETKKKISATKISEKNPMWKGSRVGKYALHRWVRNRKPKPDVCEKCGKKGWLDLSCKDHIYVRDVSCYKWLCRKCHMEYDGRLKKFIKLVKSKKFPRDKKCLFCEQIIESINNKKFCSFECRQKHRARKILKCLFCGKEFAKKTKTHRFCSKKCSAKYRCSFPEAVKYVNDQTL